MWLSEAIEKDLQTKQALRELEHLSKKYKDATKSSDKSGLVSAEIRWFRPNVWRYVIFLIAFGVANYCGGVTGDEAFKVSEWLEIILRVIIPIFVLAVTITSLARSLSEAVKFAGEYFNEVCRMELYCCLTLLTTIITIATRFLADINEIPLAVKESLSGICMGGTLWCITGIGFIIRETIRCAQIGEAVKVATNYAANKLSYGLVASQYLNLWMAKYSEIIDVWCQRDFKAIQPPSQYLTNLWNRNTNSIEVGMGFKINVHEGAVDYRFEALKELDHLLRVNEAKLFLYPHNFQKDSAKLGVIEHSGGERIDGIINKVKRIAEKGCRFHRDRIQERSKRFWSEHFNKLENALSRAIRDNEISQMHSYLDSLFSVIEALERAREEEVVRKANDRLDKCWDLVDLYRRSLRQILLDGTELKHQDKANSFTQLLVRSLDRQVVQMLRNGDWSTLKLLAWIVPAMYGEYEICAVGRNSVLWDSRARFGRFYAWADSLFEEHCAALPEETQTKMRVILHEGATKWLLMADKKKDAELVSSLCSATKDIAFGRGGISFKRKELPCQHLILLGKTISRFLNNDGVRYDDVKNLISEGLEEDPKVDFEELVDFYLNSQLPIESHDEYFHLFVDYVSEGRTDPLRGISVGPASTTGLGQYEIDLSFAYLGSFAVGSTEDPEVRGIDYRSIGLKEAIKKLKEKKEAEPSILLFHQGLEKIEEWVNKCSDFHKQQEARRIAESIITKEVWRNYDEGFKEGLQESVPFVDYCLKKGCVQESDDASMKSSWHMPKELFLDRPPEDIIREGRMHGNEIGRAANGRTIRSLIDYQDQEGDSGKDVGIRLIGNDEARKKASKEVQKAIAWLKSAGCPTEQGLIILKGIGPDVLHLLEEGEYRPAWREEGMERGIEGYYHGYRTLYLRGVRGHPLCAAIDLRGWSGLTVRPALVRQRQAVKVSGIRERTQEEIGEASKREADEIQAKAYCVVEVELFWKMPEQRPKQKVFPYPVPSEEGQ